VKVPLWAAKETWEHSFRKELKSRPLQTHAVNLANQIKRFSTEARRYVDDESVSQPAPLTKEEYETQLKEAGNTVMKLAGMVSAHERKPEQTAATLIPFFNERLLKSNLIPILARVQGEGALRAKHRIPPGFSDVATSAEDGDAPNRGKVANPHGDLIIWFEILEYVRTQKLKFLVLITRDTTKGDWVYIPRRLNDSKGRQQENTSVTLPQPLLQHEAESVCPELQGIHVVSLVELAQILSSKLSNQIPKLLAALQSEDEPATSKAPPGAAPQSPLAAATKAEPVTFNSSDLYYDLSKDDPIDGLIRRLRISDWKVQNQAVQELAGLLANATSAQLKQIGLALALAANSSAVEPLEFVQSILENEELSKETRGAVLVGVLAEIYLTENGELKKPFAVPELSAIVFHRKTAAELQAACDAVLGRLQPQRSKYLGLPLDVAVTIPISFALERDGSDLPLLRGISSHEHDLLEEAARLSEIVRRLHSSFSFLIT
jgi:hypothetical protein